MNDESLLERIEITYRDNAKEQFSAADEAFPDLVKEGFEAGNLGHVLLDRESGSLHIEFGDRCCNIQIELFPFRRHRKSNLFCK
jgi:hypothetical protein